MAKLDQNKISATAYSMAMAINDACERIKKERDARNGIANQPTLEERIAALEKEVAHIKRWIGLQAGIDLHVVTGEKEDIDES